MIKDVKEEVKNSLKGIKEKRNKKLEKSIIPLKKAKKIKKKQPNMGRK